MLTALDSRDCLKKLLWIEQRRQSAGRGGAARKYACGKLLERSGVSADTDQAETRAQRFHTLVENMEGYALALAGYRLSIPVGEVRAVSNMAGIRDKSAWNYLSPTSERRPRH